MLKSETISDETAEKILDVLERQDFSEFYNMPFQFYIEGDEHCLSREQILGEIKRFFRRLA